MISKSEKLGATASGCQFYSIGQNAICSVTSYNETVWYINGKDGSQDVHKFNSIVGEPFISEDLCSSQSFYLKNARYQFSTRSVKQEITSLKGKLT